eukprot:1154358-Pelagomonas_calceolata.AAC.3
MFLSTFKRTKLGVGLEGWSGLELCSDQVNSKEGQLPQRGCYTLNFGAQSCTERLELARGLASVQCFILYFSLSRLRKTSSHAEKRKQYLLTQDQACRHGGSLWAAWDFLLMVNPSASAHFAAIAATAAKPASQPIISSSSSKDLN